MPENCIASIVVHSHGDVHTLRRTFQSIGRQTFGLDRVEVVFAPVGPGDPGLALAGQWRDILACPRFSILSAEPGQGPAEQRTSGLAAARGRCLVGLASSVRLDPRFLELGLAALDGRVDADLAYSDYLHAGPRGQGLIRLPDFDPDLLRSRNIVGPVVLLRRQVFEECGGFRDNTLYLDWDFWLRAASRGHGFVRVPQPLYSVEDGPGGHSFRVRAEDGRAKAMLVINNHAFFDARVLRWALEYLRGAAWATACSFGVIPGGREVSRLIGESLDPAAGRGEADRTSGPLDPLASFRRWHSAQQPS